GGVVAGAPVAHAVVVDAVEHGVGEARRVDGDAVLRVLLRADVADGGHEGEAVGVERARRLAGWRVDVAVGRRHGLGGSAPVGGDVHAGLVPGGGPVDGLPEEAPHLGGGARGVVAAEVAAGVGGAD